MARGTWEDFTSKYGFRDGAQVTSWDVEARDILVSLLNVHPVAGQKNRYEAYDRPGFHNPCLILVFSKDSDEPVYTSDPELAEIYEILIDESYESGTNSRIGD